MFSLVVYNKPSNPKIHPWFITGFTDAEATFSISIRKSKQLKTGWIVNPVFYLELHRRDMLLLEKIKEYFGVGSIHLRSRDNPSASFYVRSIKDVKNTIIPHYDKFQLRTKKYEDFLLFKQAVELISNKEHLTQDGLQKIVAIRASMNKGLTEELKLAFPNTEPKPRPVLIYQQVKDPWWLSGFTEGEGCFMAPISKSSSHLSGLQIQLKFHLTQNLRDIKLLEGFVDYLGCGKYVSYQGQNWGNYLVAKFPDIYEKIIPFFIKYPLQGVKKLDFECFCLIAELIKNKAHLSEGGLAKIREIKTEMNKSRTLYDLDE